MSRGFSARSKVAIAGYAHSDVVRHSDRPLGALAIETAKHAIDDAGLRPEQIDGFASSALLPTAGDHAVVDGVSTVTSSWLAQHLGLNPRYATGFQGNGQTPGSVALAVNAIASGAADHVLVHRALHNPVRSYHGNAMQNAAGSMQWVAPQGYFGPLAMIGLTYNEYLQRFGASPDAMATVLVEARKNGARIPWSYWHGRPLSEQDYLDSPVLTDPIRRLDCDIPVDGVAAFVLTSAERAKDLPHQPVYVAGYASGSPTRNRLPLHWPLDDVYETGTETARRLWDAAGVGPADVDLPQLYDGFSPFVYFWLEVLGFCPVGEAHRFVQDGGIDSDSPSGLPVLSGGGALGNGRMHGIPQMLECYLQLAGRAGDRQRDGVSVGLACHASPHLGGAVLYARDGALTEVPVNVPDELDELLTPAWLSAALGLRFPGIEVTAVEAGPVISRVSTNAAFRIECAGGVPDGLSAHLVAKGYFGEAARAFRSIGESEAHFYRDLADRTGVRTLRSVWADIDPESRHGVVITENALVAGGQFLDPLSDFTPDQVAESLEQLATLHAATWMQPAHAGERTLDPRFHMIAELGGGLDLIEANLDGDLGAHVPTEAHDPRRLHEAYPTAVAASAQATPWAVIHGDAHVGNVILDEDGHPGMVDWQLVQRGGWYMDVGYHLASTLPVEERRQHEDDLLRHYLDHLRALGVEAPAMDDARPAVAVGMVHGYYLWAITRYVDPPIIAALLERLGAAVADHGAFDVAERLGER